MTRKYLAATLLLCVVAPGAWGANKDIEGVRAAYKAMEKASGGADPAAYWSLFADTMKYTDKAGRSSHPLTNVSKDEYMKSRPPGSRHKHNIKVDVLSTKESGGTVTAQVKEDYPKYDWCHSWYTDEWKSIDGKWRIINRICTKYKGT